MLTRPTVKKCHFNKSEFQKSEHITCMNSKFCEQID